MPPPRAEDVGAYLHDAAHTPGGHTPAVLLPRAEGEVAWALRQPGPLLAVGAQSSLTGGATPFGERLLSLSRMDALLSIGPDRARAQAGLALLPFEAALKERGLRYPPAPTWRGATLGGVASTNAAGAATFRHGTTRDWVRALTVVLPAGDVLDVERGQCVARAGEAFEIARADGSLTRVPTPTYALPDVPKRSAGYHAAPELDLVDLFVGSEGTLGVITEVEVRLAPAVAEWMALVPCRDDAHAFTLTRALREASRSGTLAVAAIESIDARCVALLAEEGKAVPRGCAGGALFVTLEPHAAGDDPLEPLLALLEAHGAADGVEVAGPDEPARQHALAEMREAVPVAVGERLGRAQRSDPRVRKAAADMIVPFDRVPAMVAAWHEAFSRRGLDHAIWGHLSDGNLHANALMTTGEQVALADAALLETGRAVIAMGGCPMSEHGVGRNPVKQALLRDLLGEDGLAQMRRMKAALDPEGKLAPGVMIPRTPQ